MDPTSTIFSFLSLLLFGSATNFNRDLPSESCRFPAIFNFGASNSDTGGYAAAFIQLKSPNGDTFFGMPAGRFCDGRLIVDFTGGIYASLMPREETFSKALYTFDIGQNDLTQSLFLNMTIVQVIAAIPDIVNHFSDIIKNLYNLGARSFWVYNTRPLGCFPKILTSFPLAEKDSVGCAKPYNLLAQRFNVELKNALARLRIEFPLATIVYVDLYAALYSLYTHPTKNGFEHPLVACCGYGGKYNYSEEAICGGKISVNGKNITVGSCKDPSVRVSWDGVHFTEAANKFAFDLVSSGDFSDPPIPLKLACHPR
uniref:Esterase n=1 Tax=Gossypium raimondii TaxID=29730 RepID=A0A0D2Q4V1_GOSRA|nr:hypothetical protein B456_001G270300 [Gossypium raimondii]